MRDMDKFRRLNFIKFVLKIILEIHIQIIKNFDSYYDIPTPQLFFRRLSSIVES
jgi:hypothetical protein